MRWVMPRQAVLPEGTGIPIDPNAKAIYHTHWDLPGKSIMVDLYGRDVSDMSFGELQTAIGVHTDVTARGHGGADFTSPIDSFVINRYETSFSVGGSGTASIIRDSFLRFFPWYCLFL